MLGVQAKTHARFDVVERGVVLHFPVVRDCVVFGWFVVVVIVVVIVVGVVVIVAVKRIEAACASKEALCRWYKR